MLNNFLRVFEGVSQLKFAKKMWNYIVEKGRADLNVVVINTLVGGGVREGERIR